MYANPASTVLLKRAFASNSRRTFTTSSLRLAESGAAPPAPRIQPRPAAANGSRYSDRLARVYNNTNPNNSNSNSNSNNSNKSNKSNKTSSSSGSSSPSSSSSSSTPSRSSRPRSSGSGGGNARGGEGGGGGNRRERKPSAFTSSQQQQQVKPLQPKSVPAPKTQTDWNNPLYSRPGFAWILSPPPSTRNVFDPSSTTTVVEAPAPANASKAAGKGGKKAPTEAAAGAKATTTTLSLPNLKSADAALKLHLRKGGRNVLGDTNNPTAAILPGGMSGDRTQSRISPSSTGAGGSLLAEQLKSSRLQLQNETVGGDYSRYLTENLLSEQQIKSLNKTNQKAVQDAAKAVALNDDLGAESKKFVIKTVTDRLATSA